MFFFVPVPVSVWLFVWASLDQFIPMPAGASLCGTGLQVHPLDVASGSPVGVIRVKESVESLIRSPASETNSKTRQHTLQLLFINDTTK